MSRTFRKSLFFAATALSVGLPIAAIAQDDNGTEQIVVTARRVEERLEDVPMSITVYNQQQLTDRNITSANDLANYTPSLSVDNQFGVDGSALVIRGFKQDIGTSPTVGTYFDDVVAPRGGFGGTTIHAGEGAGPGSFFDLENVQVLKGPQGTLFGRNTTGGSVLLVPQKPTDDFEGYVQASLGDYGLEELQGVINIPVTDHVRFRAGFDQETRDGYITNISSIGPSTLNNVNYFAGRVSVDADITSDIENYTVASFSKSDNHGSDTQLVGCDPTQSVVIPGLFGIGLASCNQIAADAGKTGPYTVDSQEPDNESLIQEWQVINTTTWNMTDDLQFKNIASYSQLRVFNSSSLFGTDWNVTLPSVAAAYPGAASFKGGTYNVGFTAEDSPPGLPLSYQQSFSEEPRITGSAFDGHMSWQAGLYWEQSEPLGMAGSSGPNLISCTNFQHLQGCNDVLGGFLSAALGYPPGSVEIGNVGRRFGTVTWRDYGIYAQDTYTFNDQWALTTGVRYSDDITAATTTRYQYYFPTPNNPVRYCEAPLPGSYGSGTTGNCVINDHQHSSAPTGEVNLQYKPYDDMMLYIQYARGYRQGGILSTGPPGYTTFEPEHLNAYEVGVKTILDGPVPGTVNVALFYNDFTNQQILGTFISTAGAPPNAGILNEGQSRIFGLDLDSTLRPTEDLTLTIGYTYLNSKLVKVTPLPISGFYTTFGPNEPQGSPLSLTPEQKLSFTPTYHLPLDPVIGKISIGATWTYTSRQLVYGSGPYADIPATNIFNVNVNWESIYGHPVDLEFFMTNVTDLHYPTYVDNFANTLASGAAMYGFTAESFGPPRMFGFRARYHF